MITDALADIDLAGHPDGIRAAVDQVADLIHDDIETATGSTFDQR
ncbi:hypothetical protein [Nocardiopsis sp. EMB25]|nr:hypothetical protein [Nocardiopsis sp. EMB25]